MNRTSAPLTVYREAPGTRMARHLKPGDRIRCAVAEGVEEWREVLEVLCSRGSGTRFPGQAFLQVAAPECPEGFVRVSVPTDFIVACQPKP